MPYRPPGRQRLGATDAAVIITIVVTTGILIVMSPGFASTTPAYSLGLIAVAALIGVITVRLAATRVTGPVRAVAARTLALVPPPPPAQGSPEAEE
ncbi:hypothetical protein ACTOXX_34975 [Streptomyces rubiginosohelvolus]|uniref:hypothetical protein n=1 Tax=Streptomyces rubiginosohelvolus TaxID=67362 RepID=UPI003F92624A